MAKSGRSKIKHKFKNIRREKIYKPAEDARLIKLAALQAASNCPTLPHDTVLKDPTKVRSLETPYLALKGKKLSYRQRRLAMSALKKVKKVETALTEESVDKVITEVAQSKAKKGKKLTPKQKLKW